MNLLQHAENELRYAGLFDEDGDYNGMIAQTVMELMEVFSKQGHSGFSASRVISIFTELAMYKSLTPLTGNDDEWIDVDDNFLQNKRKSDVFKEKKTGRVYYLDAIVWRETNGAAFTGTVNNVSSRQYIKSFPFSPKTFYINVITQETKDGETESHIVDKETLMPVFEYYDKFTQN